MFCTEVLPVYLLFWGFFCPQNATERAVLFNSASQAVTQCKSSAGFRLLNTARLKRVPEKIETVSNIAVPITSTIKYSSTQQLEFFASFGQDSSQTDLSVASFEIGSAGAQFRTFRLNGIASNFEYNLFHFSVIFLSTSVFVWFTILFTVFLQVVTSQTVIAQIVKWIKAYWVTKGLT